MGNSLPESLKVIAKSIIEPFGRLWGTGWTNVVQCTEEDKSCGTGWTNVVQCTEEDKSWATLFWMPLNSLIISYLASQSEVVYVIINCFYILTIIV